MKPNYNLATIQIEKPSIYPLSYVYLRSGRGGNGSRRDIPLCIDTFQLLLRYPEEFTDQKGYKIPGVSSGSALGPFPSQICPQNLLREASRRHPKLMPKPPQLTHFDAEEQWLYSDARAHHPISKSKPNHLPKKTNLICLYPQSHYFVTSQIKMDQLIKSFTFWFSIRSGQHPYYCLQRAIRLSISQ